MNAGRCLAVDRLLTTEYTEYTEKRAGMSDVEMLVAKKSCGVFYDVNGKYAAYFTKRV